jgi:excisionase family DNA binding protein
MHGAHRSPREPDVVGRHQRPRSEPTFVYTVNEVAAHLKVSPGTVRNMIEEGQLYAVRLHVRRLVVPTWALEDLLARPSHALNVTPLHRPARDA